MKLYNYFRPLYYKFVDQVIMGLKKQFNQTDLNKFSETEKIILYPHPLGSDYYILNDHPEISLTTKPVGKMRSLLYKTVAKKNCKISITSVLQMKKKNNKKIHSVNG